MNTTPIRWRFFTYELLVMSLYWISGSGEIYAREWKIDVIDSDAISSRNPGIAIDHAGVLHVAYYDDLGSQIVIRHARKIGNTWETETVATEIEEFTGDRISMEFDNQSRLHLVYQNFEFGADGEARYGVLEGGQWKISTADPIAVSARIPDIAIDPSGRPHVTVYDNGGTGFKPYHYKLENNAWVGGPMLENHFTGDTVSGIDIGSDGVLHAIGSSSEHLFYYRNDGNGWELKTTRAAASDTASIVLNQLDAPAAAYFDDLTDSIRLSKPVGDGWEHEIISPTGRRGPVSLALGPQDSKLVAFYDQPSGVRTLRAAVQNGSGWQTDSIATFTGSLNEILGASSAIGPGGELYIVFGHASGTLYLASSQIPEPPSAALLCLTALFGLCSTRLNRELFA